MTNKTGVQDGAGELVEVRNKYRLAPVVHLEMVRDAKVSVPRKVTSPADMGNMLLERYAGTDREVIGAVLLDVRMRVLAIEPLAVGSLSSVSVSLREVFKGAILSNASAMILFHNHPSGEPDPSAEDIRFTHRIGEAGKLLDIQILDHLILGEGRWVSLAERGQLNS